MANVILSEMSGTAQALYGEVQGPIKAFLESRDYAWMHDESNIAKKIFREVSSVHRIEGYGGLTALDAFAPVGENGSTPGGTVEQGYLKYIVNETWKGSFRISREMMEDKMDSLLVDIPGKFMNSYQMARSRYFAGLIGTALKNKDVMTVNGRTFDLKAADGSKLFATDHKPKVKGEKQCNAYQDAFSEKALGKIATEMQNLCDDDGNLLTLAPDTIIIPNFEDLKAEVFGVLGAHNDTTTPAGNKFNYQFGNWTVLVWNELNRFCGAEERPWLLMDSQFCKTNYVAIDQSRKELEVRSYVDEDTDANIWKGYARFGGGFVDFRGLCAGGVSFGKAAA